MSAFICELILCSIIVVSSNTMADSGLSSASTTSTSCGNGGTAGMTIDQMHGLLKEFRAVYESRLRRFDEAEPCEDTQKVVGVGYISNCGFYGDVSNANENRYCRSRC